MGRHSLGSETDRNNTGCIYPSAAAAELGEYQHRNSCANDNAVSDSVAYAIANTDAVAIADADADCFAGYRRAHTSRSDDPVRYANES